MQRVRTNALIAENSQREWVRHCVERRWAKNFHPVYIVSWFLHPSTHHMKCRNGLSAAVL